MNNCWANQEPNFFSQGNLQGQSFNGYSLKLNTKTYLNPQIVNYEFIKSSLSNSCLQRNNKIHVNPNFRGNRNKNMNNENYPHLPNVMHLNLQTTSFNEPGTSNKICVNEEKSSVNSSLFEKKKNSNSSTIIPFQSRFKKINAISLKSSNKSLYSWCKNNSKEMGKNLHFKNQSEATVKSVSKKLMNYNFNQNTYKYTSPEIKVDQLCKNVKSRLIFKSKTKLINENKTKLLSNTTPRTKLNFKERKHNASFKNQMHCTKVVYDHKKLSILRVAKAVRSKYKNLNNSEQYKKFKYKIDKRNKLPENIKKKSNSKEIRDIRKLFPNYLYNKIKISPYNLYNLNKCQTASKSKYVLRETRPTDKVHQNINQFQNKRVVKIGGILYKSTTNKLTLASQKVEVSSKKLKAKKNCVVYVRGEKFTLKNNGKVLERQFDNVINDNTPLLTPKRIDIGGVTYLRKSNNVLLRTNVHQARRFVNKAKSKSIALLTNLRKRSSMPCMIYQRFGKCNRHSKGLCMYKHDPKNIAVCKKFLRGECTGNNCLLSHQMIQEKMATCHFFLKGLCIKENCPFLHVKLSKSAAICENFLQGFCNLGKECSKKHLHQCPEFDKYGTCNLGSKCHYPHKKPKTEEKSNQKKAKGLCENQSKPENENVTVQYYLHSEIQKKYKKIKRSKGKSKEISCKKSQKPEIKKSLYDNSIDQNIDVVECFPKRIKLDKLPCFIPLNSGS